MAELIDLPEVIGLPPSTWASDIMIDNSMPMMLIEPNEPTFKAGLSLLSLTPAVEDYNRILNSLGFNLTTDLIQVAYLADNFPTDSFTNEYGESFLQGMSDAASSRAKDIMQFMGARNATEGVSKIANMAKGSDTSIGKMVGGMLEGGVNQFNSLMSSVGESSPMAAKMMDTANSVLAGARVDFPQVWRNSGFTPSYSMTVRLYNPNPGNPKMTEKYITGPIAALLTCSLPRSGDGDTYQWPFLHSITSPGIYGLSPAFISNVTIIKGGDQQSISYNQQMGIVDVRVDFGSVYNSILIDNDKKNNARNRPTLRGYLREFSNEKEIRFPNRKDGPPGAALSTSSEISVVTAQIKNNASSGGEDIFEIQAGRRTGIDDDQSTAGLIVNTVYNTLTGQ